MFPEFIYYYYMMIIHGRKHIHLIIFKPILRYEQAEMGQSQKREDRCKIL